MKDDWETPSPRAREVIRKGAEQALDPKAEWLDELFDAVRHASGTSPAHVDPVLEDGARRANLSNLLHWAAANIQRPGARVSANLSPELLESVRDMVRRDLDEKALDIWRLGQNVAWRRWMEICFGLTSDAGVLHEVLALTSRSIYTFIDDTIDAVSEVMRQERRELSQGTHSERLTTVSLILEGAPVSRSSAESRLGYHLTGSHLAAIIWGNDVTGDQLEQAAEQVLAAAGTARRLTLLATGSSMWLWLPVSTALRTEDLEAGLAAVPAVRVALGRPRSDLDGFRQSHLEAAAVQRMMARLGTSRRAGGYTDAQLVALLSQDVGRADEFVADTLGELACADPVLHLTLRTYLDQQCNAARVAERLYTHRNTVVRRLARCDELLPRPLAHDPVSVGAALHLLSWSGPKE
ncbi:PucR family transcriptional regulator [Nocardiopsis exhalans]|uniref:PucR family transcriptional regulator n=1 Tax=Nocardiopsis exhalans TaxID=163604 RepID=A0ABY5D3I3_9ACTN|nr:PucR family transcriptional regulator [Nocardiopsis exhalans]USY17798.1 PucR family transcriptional regulator [Nocardiopsis exhalans]